MRKPIKLMSLASALFMCLACVLVFRPSLLSVPGEFRVPLALGLLAGATVLIEFRPAPGSAFAVGRRMRLLAAFGLGALGVVDG